MHYDQAFFDAGIERRGTRCEKWDDPMMCPADALPLWVADMDFACAQPIVDAIKYRAEHACFGYSYHDAADEKAVCAYWQRRHGLAILPEETLMLPCVVTGLRAAVRAFTKPGGDVLILTPVYGPFYAAIEDNDRNVVGVSLIRDDSARYQMDFDAIEAALKTGIKLMLLCSPHNPVSRAWSAEELQRLVALVNKYHAVLVADEIHADFVYAPGCFVPMLSLPNAEGCALSLASASKTFNIAGLQQAMMLCKNKELYETMQKELQAAGAACGNIFALEATRAAYTQCDDWLDGLTIYLDENRRVLADEIHRLLPDAVLTPVEATYLAWVDLRAYGNSCDELLNKIKKHGVILSPGTFFGTICGEGFVRINFGCPRAMLVEGIRRMAQALTE